ncbi:type II toxin-antitoxin system toxin DNA ADP-ribosyl transferase DarT [Shewanella hafniensis]|uniref:type II toxin-antitoxin system toxin DNA ADP-ribosyl transferase DarT n=1 Tax=Shewanella hafniensis TaxID=365590 RepID=UPI001FE4074B|nr:DUF4433 domain-containing protein [Shewanella hafniensis]MCL1132843.1 DUF4433 domain-containing protein [Shewanella hafniensis]
MAEYKRMELGLVNQNIGYSHIKPRRLVRPVNVAAGGTIGQYVPFNFCPRSVMLFVIHKGHDDDLGGQERVLHLISDIGTIRLTNDNCFFTDIHADLDYAEQIDDFTRINELDLERIINERYWSDFKEEKQAEFLAFESVAWHTIRQIGVKTQAVAEEVSVLLQAIQHKPEVIVRPQWYY